MLSDLKFAVRQLRKSPGFSLTAVLTLALGIGANTAIFTLVDSIMLRPLPFPQQDRLMRIEYGGGESRTAFFPKGWVRALDEHAASFTAVSGFGPDAESNVGEANLGESGVRRRADGECSGHAGRASGAGAVLHGGGRAGRARSGGRAELRLLAEHFGGNPAVLGETIRIDGIARRVIGVMPQGVKFPYADTQFLTPVTFKGGDAIDPWSNFNLRAFGRLKPGVTPAQAQGEMRRLHNQLLPLFPYRMPDIWASEMTVVPLLEAEVGAMRPRLMLLFGAVGLILLIACANVANMMLARASGREREIAVRSALGATGSRLVRQLLAESVVLGAVAGVVGLICAAASLQALVSLLPADTPRLADVSLHWPVFLFAAMASVVTGDFVRADSGAAHGFAEPARVAAFRQPHRGREGGAVPHIHAAGDGTDCAVGGGDYGGGPDAAQPVELVGGESRVQDRPDCDCGSVDGCECMQGNACSGGNAGTVGTLCGVLQRSAGSAARAGGDGEMWLWPMRCR